MLVSFSDSTDRWSRFGLKVVLISLSLSLSGVKWDKVDETTYSHCLEICWKETTFCLNHFFPIRNKKRIECLMKGFCRQFV